MNILFTHGEQEIEIPVYGISEIKLYTVDPSYSTDGYFAAVWAKGELEPVPACSGEQTALLAHIALIASEDTGKISLNKLFCDKEVTYALN